MTERFLIASDVSFSGFTPDRISDLTAISALGNLFVTVQPDQFRSTIQFLRNHFGHGNRTSIYCNANHLAKTADVISLLDHGAAKVFVSHKHLKEIVEGNLIEDSSRLVLCLNELYSDHGPEDAVEDARASLQGLVQEAGTGIYVKYNHAGNDYKLVDVVHEYSSRAGKSPRVYVEHTEAVWENYVKATKDGHIPVIAASSLTTEPERFTDRIPADSLLTAALRTDRPDGLYTTVVSDERGTCLGLVYSNEESIREALRSGRGVYYSRSRGGLWRKGDTSGDIQTLINISLDCDGDALRFTVRQRGNGRFIVLASLSRLKSHRILPFANCDMLRSLLRPLPLATDTARP